jgi:hypothetical protein
LDSTTEEIVSTLQVDIDIMEAPVHCHCTAYVAANEYVRHTLPTYNIMSGIVSNSKDAPHIGKPYCDRIQSVRCFDRDIYCSLEESNMIQIKVRAGAELSRRTIQVFGFFDPYGYRIGYTWRISLCAYQRMEVSGSLGQSSNALLAARGLTGQVNVKCFSSATDILRVPESTLVLPEGGFFQENVSFIPNFVGNSQVIVHLVGKSTFTDHICRWNRRY